MSHVDELAPRYPRTADVAAKNARRRSIDWAVLVVTFALGSTLAWIYFLFRAVVHAFQVALS